MKRRILLVDDELAILLTLRAILEMNEFDVDTAASAREAEKKLKSQTYEMVITDMRMESETAGYEVIRAARQQAYDPATAILTAYPSIDSGVAEPGSAVAAGETGEHPGTAAADREPTDVSQRAQAQAERQSRHEESQSAGGRSRPVTGSLGEGNLSWHRCFAGQWACGKQRTLPA